VAPVRGAPRVRVWGTRGAAIFAGSPTPVRSAPRGAAAHQWVADKFRQATGWQVVRNAWVLLSSILETAVEYGYLSANLARGVKFPQKGLKEMPAIIAGEDLARLLKYLDEPYRLMARLIAATGLRIGELLALRWSALDLEGETLAVRESVFEGKFQPPKTPKAMRTIPLNDLKVPVKIAQEQLGHASISTTLNIYTHVVDASHRRAVEAVEERMFGEMDCFGLKSSTAVDQPQPANPIVH
jgi:integrase